MYDYHCEAYYAIADGKMVTATPSNVLAWYACCSTSHLKICRECGAKLCSEHINNHSCEGKK